jgi:hypothetical protein
VAEELTLAPGEGGESRCSLRLASEPRWSPRRPCLDFAVRIDARQQDDRFLGVWAKPVE